MVSDNVFLIFFSPDPNDVDDDLAVVFVDVAVNIREAQAIVDATIVVVLRAGTAAVAVVGVAAAGLLLRQSRRQIWLLHFGEFRIIHGCNKH